MKILTKFFLLVVAITWSLHYYCQLGQCSTQLQTVCHYTTPSIWEGLLVEKNEFYREQLNPKVKDLKFRFEYISTEYRKKIVPKLLDLGDYFYFEFVSPRIDDACQFWQEFEFRPYREWSLTQLRWIFERSSFYYNVYLRPNLIKLDDKCGLSEKYQDIYGKLSPVVSRMYLHLRVLYLQILGEVQPHWRKLRDALDAKWRPVRSELWKSCRNNEFCFKASFQLKNVYKSSKKLLGYLEAYIQDALSPYTIDVKTDVRPKKSRSQSKPRVKATVSARGNARAGARAGAKVGTNFTSISATADPSVYASTAVASGFKNDADEEEPLYTSTSTIMLTVTEGSPQNELASPQSTPHAELEISEQQALRDEFAAWFKVVDQKSSSIVKTFNKEVNKYLNNRVQQLDSVFKNKTQNVSQTLHTHYKNLNHAVEDINCTCEADQNSGNVTCFDRTGTTQLSEYITRARMRELFADAHNTLDQSMLELMQDLEPVAKEVEKRVNLIREEMVEVYEEWGDAMVSEWSKRLAYIDVVAGHLDDNDSGASEDSSENWRKFLSLKKQVIDERDKLSEHPADLQAIKQFVKKVQYLVEVLTQEAGEYLYILRARANLAFQAREQVTNKREDSPRMDGGTIQKDMSNSSNATASAKKPAAKSKKAKRVAKNDTKVSNHSDFSSGVKL